MSSLYAKYVREKYGQETLEEEHGFITYKVSGAVCTIETLYVEKEYRLSGYGTRLANSLVARLPDFVKYLSCEIDTSALGAMGSFAAISSYGFEILNTKGSSIIMVKYL